MFFNIYFQFKKKKKHQYQLKYLQASKFDILSSKFLTFSIVPNLIRQLPKLIAGKADPSYKYIQ